MSWRQGALFWRHFGADSKNTYVEEIALFSVANVLIYGHNYDVFITIDWLQTFIQSHEYKCSAQVMHSNNEKSVSISMSRSG